MLPLTYRKNPSVSITYILYIKVTIFHSSNNLRANFSTKDTKPSSLCCSLTLELGFYNTCSLFNRSLIYPTCKFLLFLTKFSLIPANTWTTNRHLSPTTTPLMLYKSHFFPPCLRHPLGLEKYLVRNRVFIRHHDNNDNTLLFWTC